jgi:NTE family protein
MRTLTTGLVLGGGAARGAYEAGVLSYLRDELEPQMGRELRLDILGGASVGAIHACYLAASAHVPHQQAQGLVAHWSAMRVEEMLRFGVGDLWRLVRESLGKPAPLPRDLRYGGLVDPTGLRTLVGRGIRWLNIGRNLRERRLQALAVSTTHVGSGRITVFVQQQGGGLPSWGSDPDLQPAAARIGPHHALASAALPVVFPPVRLRGQLHVDGGLKLSVPLLPALRLGAQRVIVISLRPLGQGVRPPAWEPRREEALTAPYLLGKVLNSLMVDRTDQDLEHLRRLNGILEAGTRAYGPRFAHTLGQALVPQHDSPVRYVRELLVCPSVDVGQLAADYVRSSAFRRRGQGLAHRTIQALVEREGSREAALASYLLFDGGFARQLIELGRQDARARRDEWLRFWSDEPQCAAEAAQYELAAAPSAA